MHWPWRAFFLQEFTLGYFLKRTPHVFWLLANYLLYQNTLPHHSAIEVVELAFITSLNRPIPFSITQPIVMVVLHAEVAKIGPRSFRINNRFSKSNRPKDLRDKKKTDLIGLCATGMKRLMGKVLLLTKMKSSSPKLFGSWKLFTRGDLNLSWMLQWEDWRLLIKSGKTTTCKCIYNHDAKVSLYLPVCVQLNTSGVFHKRPYILKSNLIRLALLHQGRWADIAEHQPCIYSVKYWSLNAAAGVREREPFTLDLSCLLISHVSFNRNLGKSTAQTHNPRSIIPNPWAWLIEKDVYCRFIINPYPSSMTFFFCLIHRGFSINTHW